MRLCIIGTGYVGLVSAACFAEMGNHIACVDVNPTIVNRLKNGEIPIFEPGLEELVKRNYEAGRLRFTTSMVEGLDEAEIAFITVGTPSRPDGSADLCYVEAVAREIGQTIQQPIIVVDKSTVPVGTADFVTNCIKEELDKRRMPIAFEVVSNPEFLKEGDAVADFMKPDRVVVGTSSEKAQAAMKQLYAPFARSREKLIFMGVRSAEMTKYAANCMLATKISFINEIANICERVGADVRDVRTGIGSDHRIGYHFIYPGVGYGGSCFPKDVKALIHTAKNSGMTPELLEAVEAVNKTQKRRMAERVLAHFAPLGGVSGKKLALWGLAFKANTDDMRESAALDIVNSLTGTGMEIFAYDPVAAENAAEIFKENKLFHIVPDAYKACEQADALLVITEWNEFKNPDFDKLKTSMKTPLLFDGRNLYNPEVLTSRGFVYFCVGKG